MALKACAERAQLDNLTYFALSDRRCYCSANLLDFTSWQGQQLSGPCGSGGGNSTDNNSNNNNNNNSVVIATVEVYEITEQEDFELSVRAFESCGAEFCRRDRDNEELVCSSALRVNLTPQTLLAANMMAYAIVSLIL